MTAKKKAADDAGVAEAQDRIDEVNAKGYLGTKVDPRPNEEYSLESGPDSPSAADVATDVEAQRADALEDASA